MPWQRSPTVTNCHRLWLIFRHFWFDVALDIADCPLFWTNLFCGTDPTLASSSTLNPWASTGYFNSSAHSLILILPGFWSLLIFWCTLPLWKILLTLIADTTTSILITSKAYLHSELYIQLPTGHCLQLNMSKVRVTFLLPISTFSSNLKVLILFSCSILVNFTQPHIVSYLDSYISLPILSIFGH